MTGAQKRLLVQDGIIGSVAFNLVINGVIVALTFRGTSLIPLWGMQSVAADIVGTGFFLPLFTSLIVTPLTRAQLRAGRVEAMPPTAVWADRLPTSTFWRGAAIGLAGMIAIGIPTVILLHVTGVSEQTYWGFVVFKSVFAAAFGAVVTPLIAVWALAIE